MYHIRIPPQSNRCLSPVWALHMMIVLSLEPEAVVVVPLGDCEMEKRRLAWSLSWFSRIHLPHTTSHSPSAASDIKPWPHHGQDTLSRVFSWASPKLLVSVFDGRTKFVGEYGHENVSICEQSMKRLCRIAQNTGLVSAIQMFQIGAGNGQVLGMGEGSGKNMPRPRDGARCVYSVFAFQKRTV